MEEVGTGLYNGCYIKGGLQRQNTDMDAAVIDRSRVLLEGKAISWKTTLQPCKCISFSASRSKIIGRERNVHNSSHSIQYTILMETSNKYSIAKDQFKHYTYTFPLIL